MQRLLALVVILGITFLSRRLGDGTGAVTALALGFALIAAGLAGDLIEHLRLPKVTGYLIFGMLCGPTFANLISRPMARELQLVNGLAVVIIAFMAGLELNFARLRPHLSSMLRVGGTNILITNLGLFGFLWLAWGWLPIAPDATGPTKLAFVLLLAAVLSCSSPSVAMAIIAETRSSGRLSELVVALVVLADIALIVLFTLAMQLVRAVLGTTLDAEVALLARLLWKLPGSLAFGALIGSLFALYLRYVGREVTLVLLGMCAVVSAVGAHLHFEPILAGLAAGLMVENVATPEGEALGESVERGALPVLVIFFASAGASLQLDALSSIGLIALLISGTRMVLLRLGTGLGARFSNVDPRVGRLVWMGLVSQAGVTLGLASVVAAEFPGWGAQFYSLVVALIALHQLVGPVFFRAALGKAGETRRGVSTPRQPHAVAVQA